MTVLGLGDTARAAVDPADLDDVAAIDSGGGNLQRCAAQVNSRVFADIFECGDVLFDTEFNANDGVGASVGDGGRFTRVPRADQTGAGEWARHTPRRATGPNANACVNCHSRPVDDGAGEAASNNVRDPLGTANPGRFIQRNPPHIFGLGGVQLLAEEMNTDLQGDVRSAMVQAALLRRPVTAALDAKGVSFGSVTATPSGQVQVSARGVDPDLIVKPYDWKGVLPSVRSFIRDATHQELGMNPVETAGDNVDGDGDGVVNEMTIEDITALTVYQAAQPRPVTQIELDALRRTLNGLGNAGRQLAATLALPTLAQADIDQIRRGEVAFAQIGCTECHRPTLTLRGRVFSEPSQNPSYREAVLPAGQNAVARGLNPANPVRFDVTRDQPDNVITVGNRVIARLGTFPTLASGDVAIHLYGDLKRHDMGPGLAENVDAAGTGASVFLTENLWGVGSTDEYLHDGRATTLTEAILEHGGESAASRAAFRALPVERQKDIVRFLKNLVLFLMPDPEQG